MLPLSLFALERGLLPPAAFSRLERQRHTALLDLAVGRPMGISPGGVDGGATRPVADPPDAGRFSLAYGGPPVCRLPRSRCTSIITSVDVHPRFPDMLLSASVDGDVAFFDLAPPVRQRHLADDSDGMSLTGTLHARFEAQCNPPESLTCVRWFPHDAGMFATASSRPHSEGVFLWDAARFQIAGSFDLRNGVAALAFSPVAKSHSLIAAAVPEALVAPRPGSRAYATDVTSPAGVRLCDARTGGAIDCLSTGGGPSSGASSVAWSPCHEYILAGGGSDSEDPGLAEPLAKRPRHAADPASGPDSEYIFFESAEPVAPVAGPPTGPGAGAARGTFLCHFRASAHCIGRTGRFLDDVCTHFAELLAGSRPPADPAAGPCARCPDNPSPPEAPGRSSDTSARQPGQGRRPCASAHGAATGPSTGPVGLLAELTFDPAPPGQRHVSLSRPWSLAYDQHRTAAQAIELLARSLSEFDVDMMGVVLLPREADYAAAAAAATAAAATAEPPSGRSAAGPGGYMFLAVRLAPCPAPPGSAGASTQPLAAIIRESDRLAARFGQKPFYRPPLFHITLGRVAWPDSIDASPGAVMLALEPLRARLQEALFAAQSDVPGLRVSRLHWRVAGESRAFPLRRPR
ncbi:hypothetical protein, variant [Fonticula alba]|uniref:Uncharacterized protein n=1 Tax=Fonticula alba TaxID=691883 RepID=A0A058Z0Z6_FONAL|nr:hypothetical protein, variant [Fonticula alba]KCV67925.1 hypothetical protein, variant [Fonticula alba]|eukprot:XP_009497745.1 hypothetical protein, variant [Fonticula alba]